MSEAISNAITKLQDVYNDVRAHLLPDDQSHVVATIDHYTSMLHRGDFDNDRKQVKWSRFNDRYGANSILGTTGEVLSVGLWNRLQADAVFKFGDGDQDTEVSGCDIVVSNPRWNSDFVVQVKVTQSLDEPDIAVFDSYLKYDYNKVHRFVLADVTHRKVLVLDYLSFLRRVDQEAREQTPKLKLISLEELLKIKYAKLISQ